MYPKTNQLNKQKSKRFALLYHFIALTFIAGGVLGPKSLYAASWTDQINLAESCFPSSTTTLMSGDGSTYTFNCDIYTGSGAAGVPPLAGADGTTDLVITGMIVESPGNNWGQVEGDYATSSSGSFRSDYTIGGCSAENMWAYVKFDFAFTGALSSIQSNQFTTRHTSTNGSSEAYEYTLITLNGTGNTTIEANIGNYNNLSDYQAGITMSEDILGMTDGDGSPGGQMIPGFWAVDDFNTTVLPPPAQEASTTNPAAGNGSVDDNQTISGAASNDSGDGNFGLAEGAIVQNVTYYFGLQDVAFDTDGDGCTKTNTLPSAGVTEFVIGYEETTAVELASFEAARGSDGASVRWSTAAEIDNAGFNVYGGSSADGPFLQLNANLIAAAGNPAAVTSYSFNDSSGATFYMLEDIDTSGITTRHGPISLDDGVASDGTTGASNNAFSLFLPLLQQ